MNSMDCTVHEVLKLKLSSAKKAICMFGCRLSLNLHNNLLCFLRFKKGDSTCHTMNLIWFPGLLRRTRSIQATNPLDHWTADSESPCWLDHRKALSSVMESDHPIWRGFHACPPIRHCSGTTAWQKNATLWIEIEQWPDWPIYLNCRRLLIPTVPHSRPFCVVMQFERGFSDPRGQKVEVEVCISEVVGRLVKAPCGVKTHFEAAFPADLLL